MADVRASHSGTYFSIDQVVVLRSTGNTRQSCQMIGWREFENVVHTIEFVANLHSQHVFLDTIVVSCSFGHTCILALLAAIESDTDSVLGSLGKDFERLDIARAPCYVRWLVGTRCGKILDHSLFLVGHIDCMVGSGTTDSDRYSGA